MPTLRLVAAGPETGSHGGEVFACAYTPDGRSVLTAAWDGCLILWDAESGEPVQKIPAGQRPLSACAVTPNGREWVSGSMDGVLCGWDPSTGKMNWKQMGHTRPVSSIVYSTDGQTMVTASWDRTVALWNLGKMGDRKVLSGHTDIVAGCRFLPDGGGLLSWSHDGSLRRWDAESGMELQVISAHDDRVTAAAVSPDGRLAASASRDETLKLWELQTGEELISVPLAGEVAACVFLLDGEALVTVGADGRLTLRRVPDLASGLMQRLSVGVQCAALSPSGHQIAVGGGDGRLYRVAVDGFDQAPLLVTATRTLRRTTTTFQRLFGGTTLEQAYQLTCPVCGKSFELRQLAPGQGAGCPQCRRQLRLGAVLHAMQES